MWHPICEKVTLESKYEAMRYNLYKYAWSNQECKRIDKIIDGLINGTINESNYWQEVRKLTKKITSDKGIRSWQRISELIYSRID